MWPCKSDVVGFAEATGLAQEHFYADQQIRSVFPAWETKYQQTHRKNSGLCVFSIVFLFVSSMKCLQTEMRTTEGVQGA